MIESVAVSIAPSSHQEFTIFIIELTISGKALYKPCATFKVWEKCLETKFEKGHLKSKVEQTYANSSDQVNHF